MIVAVHDRDGELILYLDAPQEVIDLNIPEGGRFEAATERQMRRLDEEELEP